MSAPAAASVARLRMSVLLVVVACMFLALLARLWFLQVADARSGAQQVAAAQYVKVYLPAPRGEILDRQGRVLVANRQIPVIEVLQQEASDPALIGRLAALTGMSVARTRAAISNRQYSPYAPVPVFPDASPSQILYVQEHAALFPGVTATTETVPYVTPLGEAVGNVIGYVGQIDSQELAALNKAGAHYQPGDIIGLTGVEASFERYLRGSPGVERVEVNARGQELGVAAVTPPVPGDNLRLTIDAKVQQVAITAMHQGELAARATFDPVTRMDYKSPGGSVVVQDPSTGQVIALATDPGFDPNLFDNGGISEVSYKQLLDNPALPLEDRPLQGEYAPGSTYKLVSGTAGLVYGQITPTSIYNDTGSIDVGGTIFHDDGGIGAGPIALPTALTVSSDNYFMVIGEHLWDGQRRYGPTAEQQVATDYGFGQPTGIALPGESAGVNPTPAYKLQLCHALGEHSPSYCDWFTGDSINMSIGQGMVLVTPLQMANAYSAFANGGTLYVPRIALDVETTTGKVLTRFAPTVKRRTPTLTAADRAAMLAGYQGVIGDPRGTAYGDFAGTTLASADLAGKTGTAQVTGTGRQTSSVFISFGPVSSPRYVVDCFMEDSGYGASVAAPIVREVWDQLLGKRLQPVGGFATATGNVN